MVQVTVIGNDVAQSLKVLKKKMQREGIFREMKLRRCHEKNAEKKAVERKLFPCYILIKMRYTDSLWHTIVNSRGVTGFVGPQGRPLPLTEEEVKIPVNIPKLKNMAAKATTTLLTKIK